MIKVTILKKTKGNLYWTKWAFLYFGVC